jgi:hypothetical protein
MASTITAGVPFIRSVAVAAVLAFGFWFAFSGTRLELCAALLPFFEWMETTVFGVIGKTWGSVFATVQSIHLLAMALLGGAVLASDGRLLGLILKDVPMNAVLAQSHRLFVWSFLVTVLTGVFMACGVAVKIYYLEVFWYKMLALSVGVVFVFFVRRPLLQPDPEAIAPMLRALLAVASLMVWFSVAATGRWIGYSG